MCSSTLSVNCEKVCESHARVTRLPRPFPAYAVYRLHPSYPNKGKVGVQRGRKTAGCPSFLPPPRGAARSRRPQTANPHAEIQRKTPRPLGANPLTQFAHPAGSVQKRSRPVRANTLTQFAPPAGSVQEKVPPVRGEHADAVRAPRSAGAAKKSAARGHLSTCENQIFLRFTL